MDENTPNYTLQNKSRIGIPHATFPNENLLNATLSEISGEMFRDKTLLFCLVESHHPPQKIKINH
jgi:hypothetical protein